MSWNPISGTMPQYLDSNGDPYSGAVLKAYTAGTTTNITMAIDSTGASPQTSIALDANGYPEVSGNNVIPHLQETYKLSLYPTQAAADSDTGAIWTQDDMTVSASGSGGEVIAVTGNITMDDTYEGDTISVTNSPTITLPAVSTVGAGFVFFFRNAGTGTITFDGDGSETINGSATVTASAGSGGRFISSATSWVAVGVKDAQLDKDNTFTQTGAASAQTFKSDVSTDTSVVAQLDFSGEDDGANTTIYTRVDGTIVDNTDATEDGRRTWWTMLAGTLTKAMNLGGGLWMEGATGGDQGAGTINATNYYVNGQAGVGFPNRDIFTSSGTWTKPSGVTRVLVTVIGGGGGGGGAAATSSVSGSSGGTSSFAGDTTIQATGGTGGGNQTTGGSHSNGGSGGLGSNGDINMNGGDGHNGAHGDTVTAVGGNGGASYFGGGGVGGGDNNPDTWSPQTGRAYGSGGGGAAYSTGSGGTGAGGGGAGGFAQGEIAVSGNVTVTVGAGGAGGSSTANGAAGKAGIVIVEYWS